MQINDNPILFFNSAGASLMPERTVQIVKDHIDLECRVGGYEAQRLKSKEIDAVYDTLAKFLNCKPSEVALMENATAAWHVAFQSVGLKDGDEIITVESEYVSNYLMFLHLQQQSGIKLHVIPNDENGVICLKTLEEKITDKTRLISVPHVPTNSGRINPVAEIGKIPRPDHCIYLLDACQSVGQMNVDVQKINCDFLSATSRKYIRGPRGVGFLYVNEKRLAEINPLLIDLRGGTLQSSKSYELHPHAIKFENKERNIANVLGFGSSLETAMAYGLDNIFNKNKELADHVRKKLSAMENIHLHVTCPDQCAIITFYANNMPSAKIVENLRNHQIYTSLINQAGAVLESEKLDLPELVRISVHYENTIEEIDTVLAILEKILRP